MARIKNREEYPDDLVITGGERLIGSDIDGKTKNYPIDLIKDYISQSTDNIEVNNIIQPFYTKRAEGDTLLDAVEAVNNSAIFTVTGNQVVYFRIPRLKEGGTVGETPDTLVHDYYWLQKSGKGTYGIGGSKTINSENLLLFKTSEVYSLPPSENSLPPRVIKLITDNINTSPENILNNYPTNFTITNDEDVYFEIREVEAESISGTPPVYTGEMKVYRFVGDAGIYGLTGADDAVSSDFVSYSINDTGITRNDFLSLVDVIDDTYNGKLGYAPIVSIDDLGSIVPKLKLKKIPQFEDIFSGSTVLVGGVTHITGLTYRVWATSYVINNVHYSIPVSKVVTIEDGGADPRFDVFAIRYEPISYVSTPEIVVVEGTPALAPVKPTVDLSKEVEVSFKLLLAGETSDPNVNIELVFNENAGESTEWNNIFLLSGGDLTDTDDPYIGSSCFSVSQSSINSAVDKRVSWKNDSDINFSEDKELVFALKTDSSWTKYSNLSIKLVNSSNSKYRLLNLTPSIISKYGFDHTKSGWRLLSIKLSDFIALDLSQTTFDTIEFTLNNLPDISIDWINFQSGLPELPSSKFKITKEDIKLGEVDNTSDVDKPISTAQQFALDLKADDNSVVKLTDAQTVGGQKTFSIVPRSSQDASSGTDLVRKSQMDNQLALKADDNSVVKLTGIQTIAGTKTFSTVPKSSQDASGGTDLVRKSQMDTQLALKADDNTVVKTSGTQVVGGQKTFSIVPRSSQDASGGNDLVRYSQFEVRLANAINLGSIIPITIYTVSTCNTMPNEVLSRWVYNGSSEGEFCFLLDVSDVGKEIIFTNVTVNKVDVSANSSEVYDIIYSGLGTPVTTFAAKSWVRVRVMDNSGTPYFLIVERGSI